MPMDASSARKTSGLFVRVAGSSEVDTISSLLADAYSEFHPHFPEDAWERYLGEIVDVRGRSANSVLIVAESEGALAGTVCFYPDATLSALERWPVGWASIRTVAVVGNMRRKGIGEALGRECVRRARTQGARAVGLHTASFMTAATRLYERLGFRRAPEFDIEIGEMFVGRSLPPEASWQAEAFCLDLLEVPR